MPDTALAIPDPDDDSRADRSYEIELDGEPVTGPAVYADIAAQPAEFRPIVPKHLQTIKGARKAAGIVAHRQLHAVAVHGIRSPLYVAEASGWAIVGVLRILGRQIDWWWVIEQHALRSKAAADGDSREWMRLHKEAKETRQLRGMVLAGEVIALALIAGLLVKFGPWWAWAAAAAVAIPLLARAGRPADRRIIKPAVVQPRFRKLNADIVLRAYYSTSKLGHPDKADQQITFGSTMARDGEGTQVVVDLPYGKTLKDAMDAKDSIASGLDVQTSQVFIHRDPTSTRRHTLWVADRDPLAVPVGRTPLLACKATDIWKPAPVGLDERGQLVKLALMWNSVLVGALPRQGKTFMARLLALFAALDPFVKLDVFDAAGKPDWRKFALVADSCAFGLTPTRDGLPPEILLNTLESIKDDVQDRYHRLSALPVDICPEGKLTREIARDPRYRMPVRLLIMDEFQEYYDLGDISKQIADLLRFIVKVAPAAGVGLIGATQKPAGIGGAGVLGQMFNSTRDNFLVRFALRTSSYTVSDAVLGQGAYGEGLDSSTLLPQYKGVGILRGATDISPTVRTYLADGGDAERILLAARAMRERAGTLSGMATGEETPREARDVLGDVLAVFSGEPGLHWQTLAERLADRFPDRWKDATAEAVSAQCRGLGVPSVDVKGGTRRTLMGCRRSDVETAAQR